MNKLINMDVLIGHGCFECGKISGHTKTCSRYRAMQKYAKKQADKLAKLIAKGVKQ